MANNDDRPSYGRSAREQYRRDTTNWIPGPVRRWLGLDYDEPTRYGSSTARSYDYGRSNYQASRGSTYQAQRPEDYAASRSVYYQPQRLTPSPSDKLEAPAGSPTTSPPISPPPRVGYPPGVAGTPSARRDYAADAARVEYREAGYKPGMTQADYDAQAARVEYREAGYKPGMTQADYDAAAADVSYRANYTPSYMKPDGTPGAPGLFYETTYRYAEGVQPVSYLLKGYARGALPPQGLEAFTRQFNDTVRDVYNFYEYWIRFQVEDLGRIFASLRDGAVGSSSGVPVEHVPVETAPVAPVADATVDVVPDAPVTPVEIPSVAPAAAAPVAPAIPQDVDLRAVGTDANEGTVVRPATDIEDTPGEDERTSRADS
jgi:hypothetical protein